MVTVLLQDDFRFNNNLEYLRNGLQKGHLCFQGPLIHHSPLYYFNNKRRLYDFTRSAKASIRKEMASFLVNSLGQPLLQEPLRAAFNSLYDYWKYHSGGRKSMMSREEVYDVKALLARNIGFLYCMIQSCQWNIMSQPYAR